jgi:succinate dehydrogenase / fumarate reductase flavoprotein subunit
MSEIDAGRGFAEPHGLGHVHLDLRHLGEERLCRALPMIREICLRFRGIDPAREPIPVRPVAHYSMGGIAADLDGRTALANVWAAGEVACTSLHGANRLGTNSTAECLVWGAIAGREIARFLESGPPLAALPEALVAAEEKRLFGELLARDGGEDPYALRRELRALMDRAAGVFRSGSGLRAGLEELAAVQARFAKITVRDRSRVYNSHAVNVLELSNLLELAEVVLRAALAREESRGAHARTDFPARDDARWLRHTLVRRAPDGRPELSYQPVRITRWQPVERKY